MDTNGEQNFVTIKWSMDDLKEALKKNGISEDIITKEPERLEFIAKSFSELIVLNSWEILDDMVAVEFKKPLMSGQTDNYKGKHVGNKWIPVKDRLPNIEECQKNDCRFIVTDGNRVYEDKFDYIADGYMQPHWTYSTTCQPTAWQPLPETWKGEKE